MSCWSGLSTTSRPSPYFQVSCKPDDATRLRDGMVAMVAANLKCMTTYVVKNPEQRKR